MSAKERLKEKAAIILDSLGYRQVRFWGITFNAVEKAHEEIEKMTEYQAAQVIAKLRE